MQIEFEAVRTLLVIGVFLFAGYKAFQSIHNWVISTQDHIRRVEEQIAKANGQLIELNQKLTTYENLVKKLNFLDKAVPPPVKEAMQNIKPVEVAKTGLNVMAGIAAVAAAATSAPPGNSNSSASDDRRDFGSGHGH